jgi:hypothetical protein
MLPSTLFPKEQQQQKALHDECPYCRLFSNTRTTVVYVVFLFLFYYYY